MLRMFTPAPTCSRKKKHQAESPARTLTSTHISSISGRLTTTHIMLHLAVEMFYRVQSYQWQRKLWNYSLGWNIQVNHNYPV